MIRRGLATDLAKVPHYIDLGSSEMATTVNTALRPLEVYSWASCFVYKHTRIFPDLSRSFLVCGDFLFFYFSWSCQIVWHQCVLKVLTRWSTSAATGPAKAQSGTKKATTGQETSSQAAADESAADGAASQTADDVCAIR